VRGGGGCRLHMSYQAGLIAPSCNSREGEAVGFHRHGERSSKNDFYASSEPSHDAPYTSWEYGNCIRNRSHDCIGSTNAQGSKVKLINRSEPPKATRTRDEVTQRTANILAHPVPHQGDPMS
jgi:hypothetical protein